MDTKLMVIADTVTPFTDTLAAQGGKFSPTREEDGTPTGLHVVFPNGMTLSVQWHDGAYSNVNRGAWHPNMTPTFETGCWYPAGPWFTPHTGRPHTWDDGDQVQGYQTMAQVMETARACAAVKLSPWTFFESLANAVKL